MRQPVSALRLGIPRAPFFDLLDPDVAKAVQEALAVLGKLTKSTRDVSLPCTHGTLVGESYAYEEFFSRSASRYMLPTRHAVQTGASTKAADYIRSRRKLELLRRTIDDAFSGFDLVVLPMHHRTPRTIDAAIGVTWFEASLSPNDQLLQRYVKI